MCSSDLILRSLHANPRIPTLFKDPPPLCDCPDGFAQAEAFENAKQLGNRGHWLAASEQFVALAQSFPDEPALMRNIAILCGCLGNHPMAIGAWRKYAGMANVAADDAVDAEATALLLDGLYDADPIDEVVVTFDVEPYDRAVELIASDRTVFKLPISPEAYAVDGEPPPRSVHQLLDRPVPQPGTDTPGDDAYPKVQGLVLLYGKETNRSARVVLETRRDEHFAKNVERLQTLLKPCLQKVDEEVTGQIGLLNYLGSQQLFRPRQQLDPKFREALRKLPGDMLEHDLVQRPLSVLGGKTVREAAADSAISRTAQAILLLLELQADEIGRAHV